MSVAVTTNSMVAQSVPTCTTSVASSSNPVPTSMLSFRFATPNSTQTPYYISSDIVLSGGIAQQNRRRIVHNEVEKRRKDKITNWIKKLSDLLPRHRVLKQSKNYVLETACEYIKELREMRTEYGPMKSTKLKLEQEVAELRNKINKLEEENKRLSQLIHQNKVTIPTTWSDSSVITATMRATSSPRNCNTDVVAVTSTNCVTATVSSRAQTSTSDISVSTDLTPPSITSSRTNRLSVTSILSSTSNQHTTTSSGIRAYNAVSASLGNPVVSNPMSSYTITRDVLPSTVLAVTWAVTPNTTLIPTTSMNVHEDSSANVCSGNLQPIIVAQVQPSSYAVVVPNQGTTGSYSQQTVTTPSSFERGLVSTPLRTNTAQENISQLSYSIEALTGNQTSQNRPQGSGPSQLSSFSAESLIGHHDSNNEMVMLSNATNQPVIQNTFTLSHPTTLTNTTPHSSAPPQTFSNFSALSLVGSTTPFASSTSPTLARSENTIQDSNPITHSSGQMFTDFSTESLIGSNEFSSDFAIDNLMSRSDSNVHMAAVNPNLIQSFGKGNDPMISSVSGDHGAISSNVADSHGLGSSGVFSSYLPFGNSFASGGQVASRPLPDLANVSPYPGFSSILSPPLYGRSLDTSLGQRNATSNTTNFFSSSFPAPFQVS